MKVNREKVKVNRETEKAGDHRWISNHFVYLLFSYLGSLEVGAYPNTSMNLNLMEVSGR